MFSGWRYDSVIKPGLEYIRRPGFGPQHGRRRGKEEVLRTLKYCFYIQMVRYKSPEDGG